MTRCLVMMTVGLAMVVTEARGDAQSDHDRQVGQLQLQTALGAYQMGDYRAATEVLTQLTEQPAYAGDPDLWLLLARSANRSSRPDVALEAVQYVRELGGPAGLADLEAGKAHFMLGHFDHAANLLENALIQGTADETVPFHLAVAYGMLRREQDVARMNQVVRAVGSVEQLRSAIHAADVADAAGHVPAMTDFPPTGATAAR